MHAAVLVLVPRLAAWWIRLTRVLTRVRFVNRDVVEQQAGKPYILAFWHGRLFLMPYAYPGKRIAILISEHRDGELISRTMNRFGFSTARGSTTRGGALGLREILRKLAKEEGKTVLLATHSVDAARFADRLLQVRDGKISPLPRSKGEWGSDGVLE